MSNHQLARTPLTFSSTESAALDITIVPPQYLVNAPVVTPCPNCGSFLDWMDNQFDCNWCCRKWEYDYIQEKALNGNLSFSPLGHIKAWTCFSLLPATETSFVDGLLTLLVDILWVDRFMRQGADRPPLSGRDRAFCFFLHNCLADFYWKPHSYLERRLASIKESLRVLLPIVSYTSTDKLRDDLIQDRLALVWPRELDHKWWTPPVDRRVLSEDELVIDYHKQQIDDPLFDLLCGPRLAVPPKGKGNGKAI